MSQDSICDCGNLVVVTVLESGIGLTKWDCVSLPSWSLLKKLVQLGVYALFCCCWYDRRTSSMYWCYLASRVEPKDE